mmetsp:Transcript_138335/g.327655  ORF Transcript_138335/g.327655 Transcript_138335/m.327655 type:complete len:453 (-) Transcript_138335:1252-2610(-)
MLTKPSPLVRVNTEIGVARFHENGLCNTRHSPGAIEDAICNQESLSVGHVQQAPLQELGDDKPDARHVNRVPARLVLHKVRVNPEIRRGVLQTPGLVPLPFAAFLALTGHVALAVTMPDPLPKFLAASIRLLLHGPLEQDDATECPLLGHGHGIFLEDPTWVPSLDVHPVAICSSCFLAEGHRDAGVHVVVLHDVIALELHVLDEDRQLPLMRRLGARLAPLQGHVDLTQTHQPVLVTAAGVVVCHVGVGGRGGVRRPGFASPEVVAPGHWLSSTATDVRGEGRYQHVAKDGISWVAGVDRELEHVVLFRLLLFRILTPGRCQDSAQVSTIGEGGGCSTLRHAVERGDVVIVAWRSCIRVKVEEGGCLLRDRPAGAADQSSKDVVETHMIQRLVACIAGFRGVLVRHKIGVRRRCHSQSVRSFGQHTLEPVLAQNGRRRACRRRTVEHRCAE